MARGHAPALGSEAGGEPVTAYDADGTFLVDGRRTFPIALSSPPPLDGTTPSGTNGLDEVVRAGVNFFRVGPTVRGWRIVNIVEAEAWDKAAVLRGVHTWISLSTISVTRPRSRRAKVLERVVRSLTSDHYGSGIGFWRGADEPLTGGVRPAALRFAYCRVTSRGDRRWCAGEHPLDPDHLWVTIEAPSGTAAQLAPYSKVTDTHGVDVYPISVRIRNPDLDEVGIWTHTLASITPDHSTWTTLEICVRGSYDRSGEFVLPDRLEERYMIYDAIINGARGLAFFGGDNPHCWDANDPKHHWNWTFWNSTLKGLIEEINAQSPLSPALLNPDSTRRLAASDPTTQAISRVPRGGEDTWVIAARSGSGSRPVTISGLPASIASGTVYGEDRTIPVKNGSLTDSFQQWGVHVYRFHGPGAGR